MTQQTEEQTFLLAEQLLLYEICRPDDELLEEYEDVADEVQQIEHMVYSLKDGYPTDHKIKALYHFNNEWFPDLLPAKELAVYADLMEKTKAYLEKVSL